jgi:hypothetical protein
MRRLTEEVQRFIVVALACYDTPQQVADSVKEVFGLDVPRQHVQFYDPTVGRKTPAPKWIAIFDATREAFLSETAKEPASGRAFRIRRLARMAAKAEDRKNYQLAASLYEQIAKERGGLFTNRREFTGKDGGQLIPPAPAAMDLKRLTTEQLLELERLTAIAVAGTEPELSGTNGS